MRFHEFAGVHFSTVDSETILALSCFLIYCAYEIIFFPRKLPHSPTPRPLLSPDASPLTALSLSLYFHKKDIFYKWKI